MVELTLLDTVDMEGTEGTEGTERPEGMEGTADTAGRACTCHVISRARIYHLSQPHTTAYTCAPRRSAHVIARSVRRR